MKLKRSLKQCRRLLYLGFIGTSGLFVASPFFLYQQFNEEVAIATLEFQQVDQQQYLATLNTGDYCSPELYSIFGDQWQLDASFIKWKGIAVALGFDSRYKLDRLEGRYANTSEQNNNFSLAHDISPELLIDIFDNPSLDGKSHFLSDTTFGSSVFVNIDTQLIYTLYRTEDALIVKSSPKLDIEDGQLLIEINHACDNSASSLTKLMKKANQTALNLLDN